jgi:glycosyltransferase involved in cell wall biosynthesis
MFLSPGRVGGAEQYLYNLLKGLHANGKADQVEIGVQKGASNQMDKIIRQFHVHQEHLLLNRVLNDSLGSAMVARGGRYSHMLFPNYVAPILPVSGTKVVTTIHDLLYRAHPEIFGEIKRMWLRTAHKVAINRSDTIIAVSEFVKNDILRHYPEANNERIHVIPNPIDYTRFLEGESQIISKFDDPYILSVANLYPHKNLETLIEAYLKLYPSKPRAYKLILVGQLGAGLKGGYFTPYSRKIEDLIAGCKDIIQTGYISDQELGALYCSASIFCFPSIFEGFGMPAVEAMGLGIPTITTRMCSLPEVTLNEARYVESALNVDSWATVIEQTLKNVEEEKTRYRVLSARIRDTYSPSKIAAAYWNTIVGQ